MQWKIHCFADSLPSPSQSVDGGVGEGSADLDDSIVVVKTPADVSHGRPLLFDGRYLSVCSRLEGVNITYPAHPGLETRGSDDVWHDQPAHLYTPGSGEDTQGSTHLIEADWHEVNVRGPHRLVSFIPILAEELTRWNFTLDWIFQSTYWLLMENNICWSKKVISSAISSALKLERLSVEGNWNDHDHRIETVSFVPQEASESHWDWFCFFHFSSPPRGAARRSYVPPVTVWTSRQFPPGNLQSNFLILSHQSPDRAWWSSVAKHSKPSCWRRSLTGIFSALLSEWRFCVLFCDVLLHQFTIWSWRSRGLLEPAIATAKARAAVLELDLQWSNIHLNVNMWRESPHLLPACLLEVTTTPILVKLLGLEDSGDFPLLRPLVPLSASQSPEEEWRVENAFFFFLPNFPNVLDEALVKGGVNVILVLGWHWMCWASSSQEW